MHIFETFQNRLALTIGTILAIASGVYTQALYQSLDIPTLKAFLDSIGNDSNGTLLKTWGLNLFSSGFLGVIGGVWIREAFKGDFYHDSSEMTARITCGVTGLLCVVYGVFFLSYILTGLLGIVIAVAFLGLILWSNNNKK